MHSPSKAHASARLMATKAEQNPQGTVGSGSGSPGPIRGVAWIVSFGPVGAGSDGYLVRVETNAQALASLGYQVKVLEISRRSMRTTPWANVETYPALPSVIREQQILGPIDWLSNFRGQLALVAGLIRNKESLRSCDVVIVEGGLLFLSFALRPFRRRSSQLFVFDLITLMSALHRDLTPSCSITCKMRRRIWRILEFACVRSADVAITGSTEDALLLYGGRARVVPHIVLGDASVVEEHEIPGLVGFLGNGHVVPNREALDFIATTVLNDPRLGLARCRVIGDPGGYNSRDNKRIEFVGFYKNPTPALAPVSVCCAPMEGAGGVSTKVLAYLMNGKRTVSTPEAAHGIAFPPSGLWVAERKDFAEAVAVAMRTPWSSAEARALREWMAMHHGLPALNHAWNSALVPEKRVTEIA
jgi:hypothetical protein